MASYSQSAESQRRGDRAEIEYEEWTRWPVNWTAVWVGALAAIAVVFLFGLAGIAVGAHLLQPEDRVVDLNKVTLLTLAFGVFGAFFSFVVGGWVAGKVAGIRRSEPAMLHGALVWLVAVPAMVLMAALGAGSLAGGWYAGLAGTPSWATPAQAPFNRPELPDASATADELREFRAEQAEFRQKVRQWREDAPKAARNSALGAITALLLGLVGSVIGGWIASGEPMTLTYYRTRQR